MGAVISSSVFKDAEIPFRFLLYHLASHCHGRKLRLVDFRGYFLVLIDSHWQKLATAPLIYVVSQVHFKATLLAKKRTPFEEKKMLMTLQVKTLRVKRLWGAMPGSVRHSVQLTAVFLYGQTLTEVQEVSMSYENTHQYPHSTVRTTSLLPLWKMRLVVHFFTYLCEWRVQLCGWSPAPLHCFYIVIEGAGRGSPARYHKGCLGVWAGAV